MKTLNTQKYLNTPNVIIISLVVALIAGCSKGTTSYSLLTDADDYKQQAVLIPKKIDILWVIDNSGSMETSQTELASNFQAFINSFQDKKYDFRMAVITTDAYKKQFNVNSTKAKIRDGACVGPTVGTCVEQHSGVFVIDKNTPNLTSVFTTNITQGILGDGDERALESFRQGLLETDNSAFRREEAFLAVIIVSDEEDFSGPNSGFEDPNTYPVQDYVDFLKDFTKFDTYGQNFSVSAIYTDSASCKATLDADGFSRRISTRLPDLVEKSGGAKASLCENFGTSLEMISDVIIQTASVFKLSREPDVSTISVKVDGNIIPKDPANGWTYNAANWTIQFHGTSKPAADANIQIDFYPKSIKL